MLICRRDGVLAADLALSPAVSDIPHISFRLASADRRQETKDIPGGKLKSQMSLNPKHFSTRDRFASLSAKWVPDGSSDPDGVGIETPKYRADDFLVPSADSGGRSARCQCRVPPIVAREIQEIIHGRKFPFRTDSDVVRWCLMYGLAALAEMEVSPGFLQRAIAEMAILRDNEIWARQTEVLTAMEATVQRFIAANKWHDAKNIVLDALARFRSGEQDKWRDTILSAIETKFRHVLEYRG